MFSVTKTGLKTLPLCTLKVSPTKSGVIIERRDQVLIGDFDLVSLAFTIFSVKCWSTNGPFFIERPIGSIGVVERWSDGVVRCRTQYSSTPILHYSDTPSGLHHFCFTVRPSRHTT